MKIPSERSGLCHLEAKITRTVAQTTKGKNENINDAHEKLGHLNEKQVRLTYKMTEKKLGGKLKACKAYMSSMSKTKAIKKKTEKRASVPGKRFFIDTTRPFKGAIDG